MGCLQRLEDLIEFCAAYIKGNLSVAQVLIFNQSADEEDLRNPSEALTLSQEADVFRARPFTSILGSTKLGIFFELGTNGVLP